jgi:hypothetical protein
MSDGNRNPEGFRTEERSPPGRGVLPPMLCRPEGTKKGMEQMRTQVTEVNSEKKMGKGVQELLDC